MAAPKGFPRTKRVRIGAHTLEVYSIGCLADASGIAAVTLRLWQRQKTLPAPLIELPGGMRFYTALEISTYASLIRQHYTTGRNKQVLNHQLVSASTGIRRRLESLSTANECPVEWARLHIKPKPLVFHEDKIQSKSSEC